MAELNEVETAPPYELRHCDRNTIESALAAPRWDFEGLNPYPTLAAKAAVLLYALARSQACPDGKKRIALILLVQFLYINGYAMGGDSAEPAEMIGWAAMVAAHEREDVVDKLTEWLDRVLEPVAR